MGPHAPVDLVVVEVRTIMKEGLPDLVQSGIVEVLGLESCFIDGGITWIMLIDDMLLS